eukprot:362019-Chlamydomonas_euryale.AAC.2
MATLCPCICSAAATNNPSVPPHTMASNTGPSNGTGPDLGPGVGMTSPSNVRTTRGFLLGSCFCCFSACVGEGVEEACGVECLP